MPVDSPIDSASFAALDFESAGSRPGETDVPIQIGIACMGAGLDIRRETFFRSYIEPGREVSWAASKVHGIKTGDLGGAPQLFQLWPEIRDRLRGKVVVAHSASTEKRFLRAFPMHGFRNWVDTLKLARAAFPAVPDHSLGGLVEQFQLGEAVSALCPDLEWHDALYDSVASLVLLRHIVVATGTRSEPVRLLMRPDLASYYRTRAPDK